MGRDARSFRIGQMILLVAVAFQGVTPRPAQLVILLAVPHPQRGTGRSRIRQQFGPMPVEDQDQASGDVLRFGGR